MRGSGETACSGCEPGVRGRTERQGRRTGTAYAGVQCGVSAGGALSWGVGTPSEFSGAGCGLWAANLEYRYFHVTKQAGKRSPGV